MRKHANFARQIRHYRGCGTQHNTDALVLDLTDKPIPGLYAAGELVGGLFYQNYPGGTGLLNGSVFGRLAGRNAGQAAQ